MRCTSEHETGAALLSVLLMVAFMSIAALALMDMSVRGIQTAKAGDGQSRALWQIMGAEQAALGRIEQIFKDTDGELSERVDGLDQEIVFSLDNSVVTARLEEAGNCFNVNALVKDATEDEDGFDVNEEDNEGEGNFQSEFDDSFEDDDEEEGASGLNGNIASPEENYRQLLSAAGLRKDQAELATNTLLDWTDFDNITRPNGAEDAYYRLLKPSYLTSGTQLAELSELRAIRGYNKTIIDQISPLLCARQDKKMSILNINTLKPEHSALLSMVFAGELSPRDARNIIENRPEEGWLSVDEMFQERDIERVDPENRQPGLLSTRSKYIRLVGRVSGSDQALEFSSVYSVDEDSRVRLISRKIGGM